MIRSLSWLVLAALTLLLSACGFQLRGLGANMKPLPFASLYLDTGKSGIAGDLQLLLARDNRLTLTKSPKDAAAVLSVLYENQKKEVLTINSGGRVNEYQLVYRVAVRTVINGVPVEPDMSVIVRREMNYSDSAILGKEQEEALLWSDARRDAADQIVRRLAYLKRPTASEQPAAKPAHAITQP